MFCIWLNVKNVFKFGRLSKKIIIIFDYGYMLIKFFFLFFMLYVKYFNVNFFFIIYINLL